jgi:hypothetical protein
MHAGLTPVSSSRANRNHTGLRALQPMLPRLLQTHYEYAEYNSNPSSNGHNYAKPGQLGVRLCTQLSTHDANYTCRNLASRIVRVLPRNFRSLLHDDGPQNSCGDTTTGKSGEMIERHVGAREWYPSWHVLQRPEMYIFAIDLALNHPVISPDLYQSSGPLFKCDCRPASLRQQQQTYPTSTLLTMLSSARRAQWSKRTTNTATRCQSLSPSPPSTMSKKPSLRQTSIMSLSSAS